MSALTALRQTMADASCDYYLVGSSDPHHNEYVPDCWQRRRAISGFTGSAGDALVGQDGAWLWTDSRYFLQAEDELSEVWQLMRLGVDDSLTDWLSKQSQRRVGVDPTTLSASRAKALEAACDLIALPNNLVDACVTLPDRPAHPIVAYPDAIAGESINDKLARLRADLQAQQADYLLVSALDNWAWLTNTRGTDIDYNPLTLAYAIVGLNSIAVFTDAPIDDSLNAHWAGTGITIQPYDTFHDHISHLSGKIWLDPATTSWHTLRCLSSDDVLSEPSPITGMKAIKNNTERKSMIATHEADALALIRFFHWLSSQWQSGITECSAASHLAELRLAHPLCRDLSFPSISAFGAHGAIIHYQPAEQTDCRIDDSSVYLLDSGGQYWGGTTDVTRCVHLGKPTDEQKRDYTLVLKAHLALRHAVFAAGTTGYALDCLTRQSLWRQGHDFGHGTGHGVGAYLCVHEGPQNISPRPSPVALEEHMIVSNEPGLYRAGKHGIRIENLLSVITLHEANPDNDLHKPILGFEDLTLVPYDRELIEATLLTAEEQRQVNDYHQLIWDRLARQLEGEPDTLAWLKAQVAPLTQENT